jgi:hypothetical protein
MCRGGHARYLDLNRAAGTLAARFVVALVRSISEPYATEFTEINGEPPVILRSAWQPCVAAFTLDQGYSLEMRLICNPDNLRHLPQRLTAAFGRKVASIGTPYYHRPDIWQSRPRGVDGATPTRRPWARSESPCPSLANPGALPISPNSLSGVVNERLVLLIACRNTFRLPNGARLSRV